MSKFKYPAPSKDLLYQEYIINQKSIMIIGKELKLPPKVINYYLIKFNIPRRKYKSKLTKKFLIKEFINNGKTATQIGKELNLCTSTVSLALQKYNLRKTLKRTYLNKKYGHLLIIDILGKDKHNHTLLKCKCDCGKIIELPTYVIATKNTKSCGCKTSYLRSGNKNYGWSGYEEISGTYWNSIVEGAKERNLEFNITIQEAWQLFIKQNRKCALSGQDIFFSTNRCSNNLQTASLDRIDSTKGYTTDNIQWIDKLINKMKQNIPENIFIEKCQQISQYRVIL